MRWGFARSDVRRFVVIPPSRRTHAQAAGVKFVGIDTQGAVNPDWSNPTLRKILASKGSLDHKATQEKLRSEGNKQAMKVSRHPKLSTQTI